MTRCFLGALCLCLTAFLSISGVLFGQGADRAVVGGQITDTTGAAVPSARVTITNQDTGVKIVVSTDSAGAYGTPEFVLGTYTILVEKEGFETFRRTDIPLTGGLHFRQDVVLQVGKTTTTIEVKAATEMINTQTPEVSHSIGQRYYEDLPAVMGADIRLAEQMLQVQPGYVPAAPNGDAMFRGSQFEARVNGGQTMAIENWFDGATFGYGEGHQQTQESSLPYEAVKEVKVIENQFPAEYGATSGAVIMFTTKSGSNNFHGDVYDYLISGKEDARIFFLPNVLPLTQDNAGFSLGGPVWIPHVYNGRNKTFFFSTFDWLGYHSTVDTGFVNTIPTSKARTGDFSEFLGSQLTANGKGVTDALGRPMYSGEVFNPATLRMVGGIPVRDGYGFDPTTGLPTATANMIPANDPLRSAIAAKIVPDIQNPDRNTLTANGMGGYSDDNDLITVQTWLLRIDHQIGDKFTLSDTFYKNNRPRTAHCGAPMGCATVNNGQTDSAANDTFFGVGFYQLITNHNDHLQLSYVIKPNLFNHTTLAYDRWTMGGHSLSTGVGWNTKLPLKGIIDSSAGPPGIGFGGGITPYTGFGNSWTNGYEVNNRYQFLDDLTWIRGKHTVKAGWEYRFLNIPQKGWAVQTGGNYNFNNSETAGYDSAGNNLSQTGDAFASFLLGQVDNAYFNIPLYYTPHLFYNAGFIQDDIKLTSKLTMNIGVRFDYLSGLTEEHNRFSTFSPTATQVINGVTVPGAMIFAGPKGSETVNGVAVQTEPVFEDSHWNAGPRIGFAYSPTSKNVIRGGYGIFYATVASDQWMGKPITGFQTTPTAPNLTNGRQPAFYWDNGFPTSDITYPPQISPGTANGTSPITVQPNENTMPRYQNWSLSYQRQLTTNSIIDIEYVGNHATRLISPWQMQGTEANELNPSVFNTYTAAQLSAAPPANLMPWPGFTGDLAQALRPWPQYYNILYRTAPNGNSIYHALQAMFEKRMSQGLQFRASFVYSKLINNGAEAGQGGQTGGQFGGNTVQNPACVDSCERSVSVDNVPQYLALSWIYELPFGPGKPFANTANPIARRLVGGWKVAALQVYQAGRPLQVGMSNDLGGLIFNNNKRPNVVQGAALINKNFKDPYTDFYMNYNGWTDPGPDKFGDAPRTDPTARGFPYYNEDLNVIKDTRISETSYVRFEFQLGNIFNRVDFCLPNQYWSSTPVSSTSTSAASGFGTTGSQCNIPRRIQFGLTVHF